MHKVIFLVLGFLTAVSNLLAQQTVTPETQGFSAERLQRIDQYMDQLITEDDISGSVVLIARKGKLVYHKPFGKLDKESGTDMPQDAIFRLASMTKPITSVAIMMLYEEGKLRLDDHVAKYIPAFAQMQMLDNPGIMKSLRVTETPLTIRHLLTHTSGLVYHWNGRLGEAYMIEGVPMGLRQVDFSLEEGMRRLAAMPLLFEPGSRWHYGLNTDLLGLVVEKVSGLRLDRFVRERIFEPLEMRDTFFYLPDNYLDRLAVVYDRRDGQPISRVPEGPQQYEQNQYSVDYPYGKMRKYFSGGAGLSSTAHDYFLFLQMLLNGGILDGKRILSPSTVAMMTRNQIADLDYPDAGYQFGYGFRVHSDPSSSGDVWPKGVYDWGGFFNTRFWVDPENEIIGIVMNQLYPEGKLGLPTTFRNLTYQALVE